MNLIIDGYNLIFTCGLEGRTRTPHTLEKARERLIAILASHFHEAECRKTTVVFDAKRLPIKETQADSRSNGVRVLYAVGYEDADTLIEELIRKHSAPKQLTVVSSDHRIQTAARRRKATAINSETWLEQLLSSTKQQSGSTSLNRTGREPGSGHPDEKNIQSLEGVDWMREFQINSELDSGTKTGPESTRATSDTNPQNVDNPFPAGYGEDLLP